MEDFLCALGWALNNTILNCLSVHLHMEFFFFLPVVNTAVLYHPRGWVSNKYTEGLCKLYVDFQLCEGSVPLTLPALFRGQQYLHFLLGEFIAFIRFLMDGFVPHLDLLDFYCPGYCFPSAHDSLLIRLKYTHTHIYHRNITQKKNGAKKMRKEHEI